jgi:hypothetical protein
MASDDVVSGRPWGTNPSMPICIYPLFERRRYSSIGNALTAWIGISLLAVWVLINPSWRGMHVRGASDDHGYR